jgi:thioredoxin-like negative regulator of GroEL
LLEAKLEQLGLKQESVPRPRLLVEADRLRQQGRFQEAESILKPLLAKDPRNMDAAMMLMRVYAQDLHQSHKAMEILQALEKQSYVSAAHVEFARRSIGEWSHTKSKPEKIAPPPESIDELLAQGYLGTVLEILEQKTGEQPGDFDLRLKYAEVYGKHCGDVHRAEKIVQEIEADPNFSPEQIQKTRAKLDEWRKGRPHHP